MTALAERLGLRAQRALLLLTLFLLWEVAARLFADPSMIAAPSQVLSALWPRILADPQVLSAIGVTLFELTIAYLCAVVFGVLIGLAIGATAISRRGLMPIVLLLYAIPQAILLPLFVLWFGLGPLCKIAFGFSHGVFPVILSTVAGLRGASPLLLNGARSMGASRLQLIRHLLFPHMVSVLFAGLRLAMTLTLLGVLLAELFVSTGGIGYFSQVFAQTFDPAPLFALIATLAAMAVVLNEAVRMVEHRFTRWK
jgi:ABC-type nitrate/sulfonate/bicarbonate transport system permease component